MDREIQFRGKGINSDKWVYGGYYKHLKRTPCPIGDTVTERDYQHLILNSGFSDWNMPRGLEIAEVKKETVGQYAGCKDKNGKKIYEGDIVKYFNSKENGVFEVKYDDCRFYALWIEATFPDTITNLFYLGCSKELEIIGNIYDNQKLLEE